MTPVIAWLNVIANPRPTMVEIRVTTKLPTAGFVRVPYKAITGQNTILIVPTKISARDILNLSEEDFFVKLRLVFYYRICQESILDFEEDDDDEGASLGVLVGKIFQLAFNLLSDKAPVGSLTFEVFETILNFTSGVVN